MPILKGRALRQYYDERGRWDDEDRPPALVWGKYTYAEIKPAATVRMAQQDARPRAERELIYEHGTKEGLAMIALARSKAKPQVEPSLVKVVTKLTSIPRRRFGA